MAPSKKNAIALHALIAFIDESGVLMSPLIQRTWSRRGQTPVLEQRGRHRAKVSVIAAVLVSTHLRRVRLYFRLHPNANIQKRQLVAFLQQLRRHTRRRIILVWDRLHAHRSPEVLRYADSHRIELELLPPYAPELNPVEYAWSYLKTRPLANFAPHDIGELTQTTRHSACRVQRRPDIVDSFVNQSPLFF